MSRLLLVGNFREMGYDDDPDAPSLPDVRGKRPTAHKAEVVRYLKKAKSVSFSPGPCDDFFDPSKSVGTHTMRTDGTYVWPDFLAGYVDRHDVELPEAFERFMQEREWKLPESVDVSSLELPW